MMSNTSNSMEVLGGNIWIDANGSYIYECKCCRFRCGSAIRFELHAKQHEKELRHSIQSPKYQPQPQPKPTAAATASTPSTSSSSRAQANPSTGSRQRERERERDSSRPTSRHRHEHEHRAKSYMKPEPKKMYGTFECQICKMKLDTVYQLKSHHEHCHSLICRYCQTDQPKPFKTEQGFWNHQRKQHAVVFQFKCTICVRAFKYRHELNHHRLKGHTKRNKSVNCDHCSRVFRSVFEKDEHFRDEHVHLTANMNMK